MTERKSKGKQAIPYLLSTTKSLARCDQYYYTGYDFKFNSKKNREYESDKHCRTNITRMWHNVIIPNAIICLKYGNPSTLKDAFTALNYAMTAGKALTAIDAYKAVIEAEKAKPEEDRIWSTLKRSFYFYALGQATNKEGLLFPLPKSKRVDIDTYIERIKKYKRSISHHWACKCAELNKLIYAWCHWEDAWKERETYRDNKEEYITYHTAYCYRDEKLRQLEEERDNDPCPEFPSTYKELNKTFGSSYATVSKFKKWLKQFYQADSKAFWNKTPTWWAFFTAKQLKTIEDKATEYLDPNDHDEDGNLIYKTAESIQNTGVRPSGRVEDDDFLRLDGIDYTL